MANEERSFHDRMYGDPIDKCVVLPRAIFSKYGMDADGDIMDVFDAPVVTKDGETLTIEYPERGWHVIPRFRYGSIVAESFGDGSGFDDSVKKIKYLGYIVVYDEDWYKSFVKSTPS